MHKERLMNSLLRCNDGTSPHEVTLTLTRDEKSVIEGECELFMPCEWLGKLRCRSTRTIIALARSRVSLLQTHMMQARAEPRCLQPTLEWSVLVLQGDIPENIQNEDLVCEYTHLR